MKYIYQVIDLNDNKKQISTHLNQSSAYNEIMTLCNLEDTIHLRNSIASKGGFKNEEFNYFVLEKEVNIYVFDEDVYIYAQSESQARKAFLEELEYEFIGNIEVYELSLIAHAYEMVGIGGYDDIPFETIIRHGNYPVPYVFIDMEEELELLHYKNGGE